MRYLHMAHRIAKLILEKAESFADRKSAIKTALGLGMPLHEIEEYLDWLDAVAHQRGDRSASQDLPGDESPEEEAG